MAKNCCFHVDFVDSATFHGCTTVGWVTKNMGDEDSNIVDCGIDDIDASSLYEIMRLRLAVFGSEQGIGWDVDLDGLDIAADTRHVFIETNGRIQSYLRILPDGDDGWKLGRVCTNAADRGQGLSTRLSQYSVAKYGDRRISISAESYLENWYAKFGFVSTGERFEIAGIEHLSMNRSPSV